MNRSQRRQGFTKEVKTKTATISIPRGQAIKVGLLIISEVILHPRKPIVSFSLEEEEING